MEMLIETPLVVMVNGCFFVKVGWLHRGGVLQAGVRISLRFSHVITPAPDGQQVRF